MSAGTVRVPLRAGSDGDATHRPLPGTQRKVDPPTLYLEKLGMLWMQRRREAIPGLKYILERLPTGYELYERERASDRKAIDRYLFGHPGHRAFDSPNRFFPHFLHLMENEGSNIGCPCTVCRRKGGRPLTSTKSNFPTSVPNYRQRESTVATTSTSMPTNSIPGQKGRPKLLGPGMDSTLVDEEGTPDVYRNLIDKLKRAGSLDEPILEPMSMDWRAEQEIMPTVLESIREQPQWVPRAGELILFVRELPQETEICRDPKTKGFMLYEHQTKTFTGYPIWEAGVVGQPPAETMTIDDLVMQTEKEFSLSYSGLRVESLPNPMSNDKSQSKRYEYVPLHHTRPFIFWRDFLSSIPQQEWHPTIQNALTAMSVFSLMGKYRFKGTWPSASIYCHGSFIGSELIITGDAVRLVPKERTQNASDVLIVKSIILKLTHLHQASDNDYDEGRPYNCAVYVIGKGYTQDQSRSYQGDTNFTGELPEILNKYEDWYPLHSQSKDMQVPFTRILGRCYEYDAMVLWFPQLSPDKSAILPPNINRGLRGTLEARIFAFKNDSRISSSLGSTWFWGDSRAEALDLHTINGIDVGKHDMERDPKKLRKLIKVMDGLATEKEKIEIKKEAAENRNLRGFMAPAGMIASAGLRGGLGGSEDTSATEDSGVVKKRGRPPTKTVEVDPSAEKKKARVMVVIDN